MDLGIDGSEVLGFFVDMNNLFEKFIYFILTKEFEIKYQNSKKFLYESNNIYKLEQKPDYVIYKDGKPILILDAKYIKLEPKNRKIKISENVTKQVYVYGKLYHKENPKVKLALVYPKFGNCNNFSIVKSKFFDGVELYILTYNLECLLNGEDKNFLNKIKKIC